MGTSVNYCSVCGSANSIDLVKCSSCGSSLQGTPSAASRNMYRQEFAMAEPIKFDGPLPSIWTFGVQQLVASIVGMVLIVAITFLFNNLLIINFSPFGSYNTSNLLIAVLTTLVFFVLAARFGPWTGLLIGVFAFALGELIGFRGAFTLSWIPYFIFALLGLEGLIVGLLFMRLNRTRIGLSSVTIAWGLSAIAILILDAISGMFSGMPLDVFFVYEAAYEFALLLAVVAWYLSREVGRAR